MPLVAGVDSSTQSCTVALHDLSGALVASAKAPHSRTTPPVSEQDPQTWWAALSQSLARACDIAGTAPSAIAAISVAAQHHGLVALGAGGLVLRPAKLWNDTTSAVQAARLVSQLGKDEWIRRTGSLPTAAFTITKLAWLAEKELATFGQLQLALLPHDWLTMQLSGEAVTDRGDASGTGYFDPAADEWCLELLALVDPDRDWLAQLPRVLGPQTPAGRATTVRAAELGLHSDTVVGPGTGDQSAAALGLNVSPGDVLVSIGTSGVVTGISTRQVTDPSGRVNGTASASGGYQPSVVTLNAAKVTDTFARLLGVEQEEMSRLALSADRGDVRRPILVPYLDGERTPDRPAARGLLLDLSTASTRESLALCAFEGVVLGLLQGREILIAAGLADGGRFILTGGASRSPAYQISFAALSGTAVHVAEVDGGLTSARGAAIQAAAVLTGATASEVAHAWAPSCTVVAEPAAGDAAYAQERAARYRAAVAIEQPDEARAGSDVISTGGGERDH